MNRPQKTPPYRSVFRDRPLLVPILAILTLALSWTLHAEPGAVSLPTESSASPQGVPPPLWEMTIRKARFLGNYVAGRVSSELQVFDGSDHLLGTVAEVERLDSSNGRLRWKTESKTEKGKPGMVIRADFGLQADPASALEGYDSWRFRGRSEIAGGPVEIWEGSSKDDPRNQVKAYIDPALQVPREAEFTIPFTTPLGSQLVKMTLTYAASPEGVWLPARSVTDQMGRFILMKRRVHLTKTYDDWRVIPR